jgi:ParB family chromosome partitioning protein
VTASRTTGPKVIALHASTGPRVATPQPATPPTNVRLGNDRLLVGAREVDISQLYPDPEQPRKHMHPERLAELAQSIATHGVLQPLVVRQDGLGRDGDMRYTLVVGGRRYAAIRLAIDAATNDEDRRRLARVPVVLTDSAAAERRVIQLVENLQREDLDPIEEARALKEIMRLEKLTTDGVAARVHRSQGYIDERIRLLRYEEVQEAVETGLLSKSAAAAVASIALAEERQSWLDRARLGEVVRAREVYLSKPNRRMSRRNVASVLPNFGNTDAARQPSSAPSIMANEPAIPPANTTVGMGASRAQNLEIGPPRARESVTTAPAETKPAELGSGISDGDVHAGRRPGADRTARVHALERLNALKVSLPADIATIVAESEPAWPVILSSLANDATSAERAYAERLLAIGFIRGMTCEEMLRALKAASAIGPSTPADRP